ncbi:MAG: hypothetical protein ABI137_10990 [Antricoccus sp.]
MCCKRLTGSCPANWSAGQPRRLAARDGASVSATAVRELAEVTRRADNRALLGALPDLHVDISVIAEDLDNDRTAR